MAQFSGLVAKVPTFLLDHRTGNFLGQRGFQRFGTEITLSGDVGSNAVRVCTAGAKELK